MTATTDTANSSRNCNLHTCRSSDSKSAPSSTVSEQSTSAPSATTLGTLESGQRIRTYESQVAMAAASQPSLTQLPHNNIVPQRPNGFRPFNRHDALGLPSLEDHRHYSQRQHHRSDTYRRQTTQRVIPMTTSSSTSGTYNSDVDPFLEHHTADANIEQNVSRSRKRRASISPEEGNNYPQYHDPTVYTPNSHSAASRELVCLCTKAPKVPRPRNGSSSKLLIPHHYSVSQCASLSSQPPYCHWLHIRAHKRSYKQL